MPQPPDPSEAWGQALCDGASMLGLSLSTAQVNQFETYAAALLQWNRKINLTAITDSLEIAIKHFVDSMAPATVLSDCRKIVDIGTGAGFPGIPLKIVQPDVELTLVESIRKKISFVHEVVRSLGLTRVTAVCARAESLHHEPTLFQHFDVAISRAFADLTTFVAMALPLVRPGGRIVAMKGPQSASEVAELCRQTICLPNNREIMIGGLEVQSHAYTLPIIGDRRTLVLITVPS